MLTNRLLSSAAAFTLAVSLSAAAAAQEGEAINLVLPAEPADLDGCNITVNGIGEIIAGNVVETLTELDPADSSVLPRLATSWEDMGDGRWRVQLREGVKFHDGEDFDADAAAAAIRRLQDPALPCRDRTKIAGIDITAEVVDDHTIDITANPPQPLMPKLMTFIGVTSPNTPSEISRSPIGTGPYVFDNWDANGVTLRRFEDYWGDKPDIASANYLFRGESALRASMVDIGEADIAVDIAPQDATNPELDKEYLNAETTRIRFVMLPPLDDIRVRKALNLAFDRDALVGTILSEDVVPATQFFLPSITGYNHDLKIWPYDPDQAQALIEEARADGVPVDKPIRLIGRIGFFPNQNEVLQALQQMWADAGLNVDIEMMESAEWLKLVNKPYPEDRTVMMIQEMHDNNKGDAAFTMRFRYHSEGQQSEMNNPEVDALIEKAEAATGDERAKAFAEANRIIAEDVVPAVPMYHMVSNMRVGPRVQYDPNILSGIQMKLEDMKLD